MKSQDTSNTYENKNLTFSRNLSRLEVMHYSICYYVKHRDYPPKNIYGEIIRLLLILGSVETNPGPRIIKFPCHECKKSVYIGPAIQCDECNHWYHQNCAGINTLTFDNYNDNYT